MISDDVLDTRMGELMSALDRMNELKRKALDLLEEAGAVADAVGPEMSGSDGDSDAEHVRRLLASKDAAVLAGLMETLPECMIELSYLRTYLVVKSQLEPSKHIIDILDEHTGGEVDAVTMVKQYVRQADAYIDELPGAVGEQTSKRSNSIETADLSEPSFAALRDKMACLVRDISELAARCSAIGAGIAE